MKVENIENICFRLKAFEKELKSISQAKSCGINIFDAIGMQRQEIKHSAFLAWLLNPNKEHGFSSRCIKLLLKSLVLRKNEGYLDNEQILSQAGFNYADIDKYFEDIDSINVETERPITKENIDDGRIDVYIEDRKNKVLIAIENKVFTSTHDNQLLRYEEEFEDRTDWKQIFVYLSPSGELPKDDNGLLCYKWCVMDYREVLGVIKELESGHIKPIPNKLKILLKDYIDMVETNILKEKKELIKLCKHIRKKYQEELEILLQYTGEEVIEYVKSSFKERVIGGVLKETESGIMGYSAKIQSFFAKIDNSSKFNFAYSISCIKGPMQAKISINKEENEEWTTAQTMIKDIIAPKVKAGNKYCSMISMEILSEEEVCMPLEKVRSVIDKKLAEFYAKIEYLENNLHI
ncbi:MAG: hypothetical protein E7353_07130 [Clostridiales bacterium]|nr:hypothetical protein [Clostridiales bacterium]